MRSRDYAGAMTLLGGCTRTPTPSRWRCLVDAMAGLSQ
jgi:hypothetical protein